MKPEPAPIRACTISRDVQNFDLLIEDMEAELGESWGDLDFEDAALFLTQPEAKSLEFVAIAVDSEDEAEIETVSRLIGLARRAGARVILVTADISQVVLHKLLRLGADDFVPYPLPEHALHEAIERIRLPEPAPEAPAAAPADAATAATAVRPSFKAKGDRDGVVLPVQGLAGGVGSTTFAVNLAWELALATKEEQARVCVLDLDLQYGSVSTYLDLPRREAILDILSDTAATDSDALIQAMQTFNEKLHVFTAPAEMLPLELISSDDVRHLIEMARANFDYVVIDMPSTVVSWTESVLDQSHVFFALLELDMRSAQNALRLIRALKAEELPLEKMRFILNRAPKFTDLSGKARVKRLAESLDISIEAFLPDGTRQVTQANDHGLPLAETAPKNAVRREIQRMAKSLIELNISAETGKL